MKSILLIFIFASFFLSSTEQSTLSPYYIRYLNKSLAIEEYKKSLEQQLDPLYALYILKMSINSCQRAQELDIFLQSIEGENESTFVKASDLTSLIEKINSQADLIRLRLRESLKKNTGDPNRQLILDYWLLLSEDNPSVNSILSIINQIKKLNKPLREPQEELKRDLFISQQALHLNILIQEDPKTTIITPSLLDFEQQVIESAKRFVEVLLEWERKEFKNFHCQKLPWKKVIPLFQKGFYHASIAKNLLYEGRFSEAITNQERTVFYWQKAIESFENTDNIQEDNDSANQMDRTLRQLQEMYMEDFQKKEQPKHELKSW